MRPSAFIGAVVGATLGALLWAGVAALTGLEIGWIAWGVGGLVGLGAAVLGGAGPATGMVCAVLALASIFAGKWLAVDMVAEAELRKFSAMVATPELYQEWTTDAAGFVEVASEDEYAEYMIDHGYSDEEYPEDVAPFELAMFKSEIVPQLRDFSAKQPSYQAWQEMVGDEIVEEWERTGSNSEVVKEGLTPIDILFGVLGIVTAFQVGVRGLGRSDTGQVTPRPTAGADAPVPSPYGGAPVAEGTGPLAEAAPNPYAQTNDPRSTPGPVAAPQQPADRRSLKISRASTSVGADAPPRLGDDAPPA